MFCLHIELFGSIGRILNTMGFLHVFGPVFVPNLEMRCVLLWDHLTWGHRSGWQEALQRQPLKKCAFLVFLGLREARELLFLNGGNLGSFLKLVSLTAAPKKTGKVSSEHPVLLVFSGGIGWVCFNSPLKKPMFRGHYHPACRDKIAAPFGCPTLQLGWGPPPGCWHISNGSASWSHWKKRMARWQLWKWQVSSTCCVFLLGYFVFLSTDCRLFATVSLFQKLGNALTWTLKCDLLCEDLWGK